MNSQISFIQHEIEKKKQECQSVNFRIYHSLDLSRIPLLNAKAVYFTKLAYCCKS